MKKGSILIEDVISLFLILIFITASLFVFRSTIESINKRNILSNMNRSIYSVESEIRYNKTFNEIEDKLKDDFYLDYNNDFLKNIKDKDIFKMDEDFHNDKYLMLKIIDKGNTFLKINIIINFKGNYIEREFYKDIWMDEV